MVTPLVAKSPLQKLSQKPIDISRSDIIKGMILKEAVTLVDKEDPKLPKNPLTLSYKELPTLGPSNPKKPDPTLPLKKPLESPSRNLKKLPTDNSNNFDNILDKLNKLKDYNGTRTKYRE